MDTYLEALGTGAANVFSWPGILIPIAGTMLAMVTSFLPGIGTSSLAAVLLVATLTWEPESVLLLFGALTGGATFMGSITAILFNIPGGAQAAASLLDGYPLGQKGYPKMAIACASTASAFGSVFGVLVLIVLLPFIRSVLLEFGPLERVLLGVWGLSTLIALPNVAPLKATAMAALGFLTAMIGIDPYSGLDRWSFGADELYGGISKIAVLIGLFTFAELIGWTRNYDLEQSALSKSKTEDSTWSGVMAVFRHKALAIRSSLLGTLVGIVPGIGGTVAGFVAYGQAVQSSQDDGSEFGKGDIRGLIAPEAATDAKDGGSLLPAIAFGLPGSEGGVLLIAIMTIHGLVPGTPMLTTQLPLTFTLIIALLFSNILTSVVGLAMTPHLARLTRIRIDRFALPALLIGCVAIVQIDGRLSDFYTVIAFGIAGYLFKLYDWPRVPFVVAFILAEFLERNLAITTQLLEHGRIVPYERPATVVLVLLLLTAIYWALHKKKATIGKQVSPVADMIVSGVLMLLVAPFLWKAFQGGAEMSFFAKLVASGTMLVLLSCLMSGLLRYRRTEAEKRWIAEMLVAMTLPKESHLAIGLLCLAVPISMLIGFVATMALVTFWWISANGAWKKPVILKAGFTATAVAAICWYVLAVLSPVYMPEPYLLKVSGL